MLALLKTPISFISLLFFNKKKELENDKKETITKFNKVISINEKKIIVLKKSKLSLIWIDKDEKTKKDDDIEDLIRDSTPDTDTQHTNQIINKIKKNYKESKIKRKKKKRQIDLDLKLENNRHASYLSDLTNKIDSINNQMITLGMLKKKLTTLKINHKNPLINSSITVARQVSYIDEQKERREKREERRRKRKNRI